MTPFELAVTGEISKASQVNQLCSAVNNLEVGRPYWGGLAGGTADALSCSVVPMPIGLSSGRVLNFLPATTNTGPATMDVGTGAYPILKAGSALGYADLQFGQAYQAVFDGSSWHLIGAPSSSGGGAAGIKSCTLTASSTTGNWGIQLNDGFVVGSPGPSMFGSSITMPYLEVPSGINRVRVMAEVHCGNTNAPVVFRLLGYDPGEDPSGAGVHWYPSSGRAGDNFNSFLVFPPSTDRQSGQIVSPIWSVTAGNMFAVMGEYDTGTTGALSMSVLSIEGWAY